MALILQDIKAWFHFLHNLKKSRFDFYVICKINDIHNHFLGIRIKSKDKTK